MRLHLFIPDLLWPEPLDKELFSDLELPALTWLLARGNESAQAPLANEAALAAHFLPSVNNPPYASLFILSDTDIPPQGRWMCADPVHLNLTQDRLSQVDASRFNLDSDEAAALIATLNQEFLGQIEFCALNPHRWYVRLAEPVQFAAPPLSQATGCRSVALMPEDAAYSGLRRLLNETQMILHAHPVNQAREADGRMTVNSLWLWGEGAMPEKITTPFDRALGNFPLLVGFARATEMAHETLPTNAKSLENLKHPAHEHVLVVIDSLIEAVQYEEGRLWRERLLALENDWFAPIRASLGKHIESLTLESPSIQGHFCWRIHRNDRWRFWRRPNSFAELLNRLTTPH